MSLALSGCRYDYRQHCCRRSLYTDQDVISDLLKALYYSNQSETAAPSKTLSTSLLEKDTENVIITDLSEINITGVSGQPSGPFKEFGGLNLVTLRNLLLSKMRVSSLQRLNVFKK